MERVLSFALVLAWLGAASAHGKFYIVTIEEAEAARPALKRCGMNVYGSMSYYRFLTHYRRTKAQTEAKYVLFPPYFTCEHNWPVYGGGSFANNWARSGDGPFEKSECRREALDLALTWSYSSRQSFVIHDGSGDWLSGQDFPRMWNVSNAIIAKGNALWSMYRPGLDVSMPPPMTENLFMYRDFEAMTSRGKSILVSFKGEFGTHSIRQRIARLHDPQSGVVIINKNDRTYQYDALIATSHFALVIRGHVPFSYRFSETVCRDTVPVLVADDWVPPFSEVVPFESYGVRVEESNVDNLVDILRKITDAERQTKRENAMRFCFNHIITPHHQMDTLLRILFHRERRGR